MASRPMPDLEEQEQEALRQDAPAAEDPAEAQVAPKTLEEERDADAATIPEEPAPALSEVAATESDAPGVAESDGLSTTCAEVESACPELKVVRLEEYLFAESPDDRPMPDPGPPPGLCADASESKRPDEAMLVVPRAPPGLEGQHLTQSAEWQQSPWDGAAGSANAWDHSYDTKSALSPSTMYKLAQREDSCWAWVKHGYCPRGEWCTWKHPPLPGVPNLASFPAVPVASWDKPWYSTQAMAARSA